ncbi:MAG: FtsQ-type POTRA domain-containing protein [Pseudomonadota bacterium]
MPKMRRHADPDPSFADEDVKVSSVLLGLAMVAALVVTAAAFMGGSLSRVEHRFANTTDSMARGVGLSVETVIVIGLDHDPLLASDVRAAAMVEPGENMFRADPHAIKSRVESIRKVVNVRVHRLWPDQVVIMADPAEPIALLETATGWTAIDSLGHEMDGISPEQAGGLIRASGEGAAGALPDLDWTLFEFPELRARLHRAERVADRRWDLHLNSGQLIRLPRDSEMVAALYELDDLARRAPVFSTVAAGIDLRVAGNIYITPAVNLGGEAA